MADLSCNPEPLPRDAHCAAPRAGAVGPLDSTFLLLGICAASEEDVSVA